MIPLQNGRYRCFAFFHQKIRFSVRDSNTPVLQNAWPAHRTENPVLQNLLIRPKAHQRSGFVCFPHHSQRRLRHAPFVALIVTQAPRLTVTSRYSDKALTTETPTPCNPPETLYVSLSNLPPAWSTVMTTSTAGFFPWDECPPEYPGHYPQC